MQNKQYDFIDLLSSEKSFSTDIVPLSHLKIYQQNVLSSLSAALHDAYPLIKKIVGDDFFNGLAKHYVERYPSRQSYLQPYGEYFKEFLAEFGPSTALVYLPQMAEFEWACHQLFYAADAHPFDIHEWQALSPEQYEQTHLSLDPASSLHAFTYPILDIVDLCNGKREEEVNLDPGNSYVLLHRPFLEIMVHSLTHAEWLFLSAINEGETLKSASDKALAKDATFQLAEKLIHWFKLHLIVDIN